MNSPCAEIRELLSPYHDAELSEDRISSVEEHLATCAECRTELASMRKLSEMAAALDQTASPAGGWNALERCLEVRPATPRSLSPPRRASRRAWMTAAVAVILTGLIGYVAIPRHDHLAIDFHDFLVHFDVDQQAAEEVLVSRYDGRKSTIEEAEQILGYRSILASGMPDGYTLQNANLLKMPCCECLAVSYSRPEGGYVAIFEHERDQPVWFGHRPSIACVSAGKNTHLVQLENSLAATCEMSPRYVTIIGPRSIEEVSRIVAHLSLVR